MTIRFIRAEHANKPRTCASKDDVIRIRRVGSDLYSLSYTPGSELRATNVVLDGHALWRWLRSTIHLMEHDTDPFQDIQMDMPLMPSVLLSVKTLGDTYSFILDAVSVNMDNWPISPSDAAASRRDADEEEDEAELEAEDDDDEVDAEAEIANANRYFTSANTNTWPRGRHHLFLDTNEEHD